jgi:two-component system NtrC family sensor kinase
MRLKKLTWYRSIGARISILASVLIFVFMCAHTYISIRNQRRQLVEEVIRHVSFLSDTIKLSTRKDMLLYLPDRLHETVDAVGAQPFFEKIRILNYFGEIIYSSDKSEMGALLDKGAEQCYACHSEEKPIERLETTQRTRIFKSPQGHRVLGMINPIYNEPDCYNAGCHVHPPEQKVLGVLDIDVSLQPMDGLLHHFEYKLLFIGLVTAFSLALLINILTRRFLNRPVKELIEGTHRVSEGDLEFQIPIRSEDEIGVLAQYFNQMTQDLKRARTSLTEWGARLEQMVGARTRDLEIAQKQLLCSEKLASLGKLSAGVAHEINNPLTGILTFSQLLMEQFPPESSEHQDLRAIVQETLRCRNIVRGLLEFARQTAPEKQPINVNAILEDALCILATRESFDNIQVHAEYDSNIPHIMADADQIRQVFLNIIVNAAEAMSNGGSLRIRTQSLPERSQVCVHFEDTGPGIHPAHIDKLFDPFFTTKEMRTGLGLAISYGIVKTHLGNIEVNSIVGEGARLTVTLPVEPQLGAGQAEDAGSAENT